MAGRDLSLLTTVALEAQKPRLPIQIQSIYGKRDERLLRSRISSWHRRGGGFACPDCARSPRMGCEAKVVSTRKSLFCYGDFRDSIEKNHPTCCQRIDRGQSTLYC